MNFFIVTHEPKFIEWIMDTSCFSTPFFVCTAHTRICHNCFKAYLINTTFHKNFTNIFSPFLKIIVWVKTYFLAFPYSNLNAPQFNILTPHICSSHIIWSSVHRMLRVLLLLLLLLLLRHVFTSSQSQPT